MGYVRARRCLPGTGLSPSERLIGSFGTGSKGRISILGFYARRIRRLLPAATLVSAVVALSIPLFPKGQWPDIVNGIIASAAYVQNWLLAAQAVDYLAGDTKGPMNHFWSLSVE